MKFSRAGAVAARSFACVTSALLVACGGGGAVIAPPAPVLSVFAGVLQSAGGRDSVGIAAQFNQPGGAAQDRSGTIYVADTGNHTIRKMTPQGVVTTFAGASGQAGNADGTGAAARFSSPVGLALDAAGNLYVADGGNHTVRRISAAGVVTTVVGVAGQAGSSDGAAAVARLDTPIKVALDGAGGMYVLSSKAVRKVAADGGLSTLPIRPGAGVTGQQPFGLGFSGIAVDGAGNVLVADAAASGIFSGVGTVRKFDPQGRPLPLGRAADGLLRIAFPVDIAMDDSGNLLVANDGYWVATPRISFSYATLLRIAPDGTQTVVAGADEDGRTADGGAGQARFRDPRVIAPGAGGQVVVVETSRNAVRLIDPQGTVSTLAGGDGAGLMDGAGAQARFDGPEGIAAAADGSLYVAERTSRSVRKISPAGVASTWLPTRAFSRPVSVAVNRAGTVYVSDSVFPSFGRAVYTVAAGGTTTLILNANADGTSNAIAVDASGDLVLAEPDGITVASSNGSKRVLAAGIKAIALAADASGVVYFASRDGAVGVAFGSGQVDIRAGVPGQAGDQDGIGASARFRSPRALAVDASGTLYVADGLRIRRVAPDGTVTTIADLATMDGVEPVNRSIAGLAWFSGALFATLQNAVIRIAPVN